MPSPDFLSGQNNWHLMYRFVYLSLSNLNMNQIPTTWLLSSQQPSDCEYRQRSILASIIDEVLTASKNPQEQRRRSPYRQPWYSLSPIFAHWFYTWRSMGIVLKMHLIAGSSVSSLRGPLPSPRPLTCTVCSSLFVKRSQLLTDVSMRYR